MYKEICTVLFLLVENKQHKTVPRHKKSPNFSFSVSFFSFTTKQSEQMNRFPCIWKALRWKYFWVCLFSLFFFFHFPFHLFSDIESSQSLVLKFKQDLLKCTSRSSKNTCFISLWRNKAAPCVNRLSWLICSVLPPVCHHNQMQIWWDNAIMISWHTDVKRYRCSGRETLNKPLNVFDSANERLKWIS